MRAVFRWVRSFLGAQAFRLSTPASKIGTPLQRTQSQAPPPPGAQAPGYVTRPINGASEKPNLSGVLRSLAIDRRAVAAFSPALARVQHPLIFPDR